MAVILNCDDAILSHYHQQLLDCQGFSVMHLLCVCAQYLLVIYKGMQYHMRFSLWCGDDVGNTIEENSSTVFLIHMC